MRISLTVSRLHRIFAVAIKHRIQGKSNNIYMHGCMHACFLACMHACLHTYND